MKRKVMYGSILSMLVVLIAIGTSACMSTGGGDRLITVLNPALTANLAERVPLAPRLDTLEGKTIYLYDTQWGGPESNYAVFQEVQAWFSRNMPSVNIVIHRGPNWMTLDKAFVEKVAAEKIDGVVIGISG